MKYNNSALYIYGPTASGKTNFAEMVASHLPAELINMDSAQCYTAFSIGTAKPDWRSSASRQHMFDVVDEPVSISAYAYRMRVQKIMHDIWQRGKLPICVGGSGFYLKSLLFKPSDASANPERSEHIDYTASAEQLWQQLYAIDPDRAHALYRTDTYRVIRALELFYATGRKPSTLKPTYEPIASSYGLIWLSHDKELLHNRINMRTRLMLQAGWLKEARSLVDTPWEKFAIQKNFIGYTQLFAYLKGTISLKQAEQAIAMYTRRYAKRQKTFWRMLERQINQAEHDIKEKHARFILSCNLTKVSADVYIKQVLQHIKQML